MLNSIGSLDTSGESTEFAWDKEIEFRVAGLLVYWIVVLANINNWINDFGFKN